MILWFCIVYSEEEELDDDAIERRREIMREKARKKEMEEVSSTLSMLRTCITIVVWYCSVVMFTSLPPVTYL